MVFKINHSLWQSGCSFITATILKHGEALKRGRKNPSKHFGSQQGNRLSDWRLQIAWWKVHSWGYEEVYFFMSHTQTQAVKREGSDRTEVCHDVLCLVQTFSLAPLIIHFKNEGEILQREAQCIERPMN